MGERVRARDQLSQVVHEVHVALPVQDNALLRHFFGLFSEPLLGLSLVRVPPDHVDGNALGEGSK